jgi:hypothetical protein
VVPAAVAAGSATCPQRAGLGLGATHRRKKTTPDMIITGTPFSGGASPSKK